MAEQEKYASIADSSKPNAGRIYDFLLGGSHNFEVDRQAAQQVLKVGPFVPKLFRSIRWFLGEAVRRLTADGFTRFIDFASGLPTVDHIHQICPAGTKVIYSDIDPVTVAYGQEIIKDNPNVRYAVCNAERPEDLLNSPTVTELLGKGRTVAIGFNGISYFMSDEQFRYSMQILHKWVDKGSRLFFCDATVDDPNNISPALQSSLDLYKKLGQPIFIRTLKKIEEIIRPWRVMQPGFALLEDWIGVKAGMAEETRSSHGFTFIGAILEK